MRPPLRLLREAAPTYGAEAPADSDAELVEDLAEEISTLAAHIHSATHRFLVLIARFDRLRGWEPAGYPNCAHWLHVHTGLDLGTAREKVRAARALEQLPLTSAAMARGELSFSKVRAVSRIATAENEGDLLDLARGATTGQVERMVRAWRQGSRRDEAKREEVRHASRTLSVFPDDDGMYVVRGRLTPEVGALLMRAVEAASDALFRTPQLLGSTDDSDAEAARRRADALALIAERALAAGFGSGSGSADAPISGSRAERYQVVLHVEPETLAADEEPRRSELEDGTRVSAETSRRLSCDASLVRVTESREGRILDVGRKTRTVPSAVRRALEIRDRGCRFPGCGRRFTDAHHVKHWADGGETSIENCLLLCRYHHRLVHEGGWHVEWWGTGRPMFYNRRGDMTFDGRWQPPKLPEDPVSALVQENELRGCNADGRTATARWKEEAYVPKDVYFRASESL